MGGELELRHKSGNTYTLSLNLYFDAINGDTPEEVIDTGYFFYDAENMKDEEIAAVLYQ